MSWSLRMTGQKEVKAMLAAYVAAGGTGADSKLALGLEDAAGQIVARAQMLAPKAQGVLAGGIAYERVPMGDKAIAFRVGPSALYGAAVEFGRKAGHWPPPGALVAWMAIRGRPERFPPKPGQLYGRDERNLARHIGKHGTKPHPFLAPAVREVRKNLAATVARYLVVS